MAGFGGSVKLTGESEYRKAIQQITQDLGKMSNALKTQASDFSASGSSMKNTEQRQKELNESIKAQQEAISNAKNAYAQYSVALQTQQQRHSALSKEYNKAVSELDGIGKASGTTSAEYKKQEQAVEKLAQKLADSNANMNESREAMSRLKTEINNSSKSIDKITKEMEDLGAAAEESGAQAEKGSDGFTVFKAILANLATQVINSAISGLKSLGSAFINVGKQAISSYASYEQLEGGVKKIFGDDMANEVISNAQNAFKTAGISANEYMENVTSFSATLLQGLGDDTSKAASYADKAMRQMADNANTFGTDISSIQHAYQGFAKGNFTMLDNLKLGYGGTQAEMARLINESGVLGDALEVTAETVKDVPFYQMIEAIEVTQERMGIMGTTAKEAAGTIEGSTGSMKAAWQNMLTGIADENANFEQLAKNFIGTLITEDGTGGMIGTLVPRIATVITGMSNAISTMLPMLIQQVVPIIEQNLPIILSSVEQALSTIVGVLPQIIPIISSLIPQIVSTIITLLPDIIDAGIKIILSLIEGIKDAIPVLIKSLPELITNICNTIIENLPAIIDVALELIKALAQGILEAIPELISVIPDIIISLVDTLLSNIPVIIDAGIELITSLVDNLPAIITGIVNAIPKIITGLVSAITNNIPQIISAGVRLLISLVQNLPTIIAGVVKAIPEIIKGIVSAIIQSVPQIVKAGGDLIKGLWTGISDMAGWIWDKVKGFCSGLVDKIKGFFGIKSPSKLFHDVIGENLALGIGEGFSDEMKDVSQEMINAIPTSYDIQSSINGSSYNNLNYLSYDRMVDAFKDALESVKIEIDDEVAGHFVEKTITRLVYA